MQPVGLLFLISPPNRDNWLAVLTIISFKGVWHPGITHTRMQISKELFFLKYFSRISLGQHTILWSHGISICAWVQPMDVSIQKKQPLYCNWNRQKMWKDALIEASLSLRRGFSFFILPLFFLNQWFMTVIFPKGHVLSNLSTCHFPTLPNSTTIEISPKTSKWPLFIHTLHIVTAWLLRFRQQEHHRQWQNSHHHLHHHRDTALWLACLFVQSTRKKSPGWQTQDLLHVFPELNTHNLYMYVQEKSYTVIKNMFYTFFTLSCSQFTMKKQKRTNLGLPMHLDHVSDLESNFEHTHCQSTRTQWEMKSWKEWYVKEMCWFRGARYRLFTLFKSLKENQCFESHIFEILKILKSIAKLLGHTMATMRNLQICQSFCSMWGFGLWSSKNILRG